MAKIALYLAGGGARGAYQAGVLKAIEHILQIKTIPFAMVTGVSVGSINAGILAGNADNFLTAVEQLDDLWRNIHCNQIFNTSNHSLIGSVMRNVMNAFLKKHTSNHLLDTQPLHDFILKNIHFDRIKANIKADKLQMMEIISNCYETRQTVSFYQCHDPSFEDWHYPSHISKHVKMNQEHLLASSALPLFFPNVGIDGLHYGDGSMGLVSPLRCAIRFNVDKILIIGTRQLPAFTAPERLNNGEFGFAHVLGNMLNGLFLDNLDRDVEMVNRMNEISHLLSIWKKRSSPWRTITTMHLRPSIDMAPLAQANYSSMPRLLRKLLNILGAQSHSGELLSFLLFENEFTQELVDLGYLDTLKLADSITDFFNN